MRTQTKNKWAAWSTGKRKWPSLDLVLICICLLEGGAKFPDWSQSEGNQHPCHPALLLTLKRKMLQLPQLKIPVQLLVPPWLKPLFLQLHNTWKKKWIIIKREITDNFKFSSSNKISWWTETKAKIKQNKKIAQNHFVIQVPAMVAAHFLIWWTKGFSKKSTR